MNKKLTYTIESEGYSDKYNKFTIEEGKTYFLVGQNGVGKSTLLKYIQNIYPSNKPIMDISFELEVTRDALKNVLNKYDVPNHEKDLIISKWGDSEKIRVFYDGSKNAKFNDIRDEINKSLFLNKKDRIISMGSRYSDICDELVSIAKNEKQNLEKELNLKIALKDMTRHWDLRRSNIESALSYLDKIVENYLELKESSQIVIKKCEENQSDKELRQSLNEVSRFVSYRNYEYFGRFDLDFIGKERFDELLVELRELSTAIDQLWYRDISLRNYEFEFSFNIAFEQVIKVSKRNDLDYDKNFEVHVDKIKNEFESIHSRKPGSDYGLKKLALSNGEISVAAVSYYLEGQKNKQSGLIFDEPFIGMDLKNTRKALKKFKDSNKTLMISSHSTNILTPEDIPNLVVMFYDKDGKRCIANFNELPTNEQFEIDESFIEQINESLISWVKDKGDKTLLLVEGYNDYAALSRAKINNLEIIPVGGAKYIKIALSIFSRTNKNVFTLYDNDNKGNEARSDLISAVGNKCDITDLVYDNPERRTMEDLIIDGKSKYKNKFSIKHEIPLGIHDVAINRIAKIIEKAINVKKKEIIG